MSTISTILSTLRSAVWAIDVRDEIANAIEQCYKDVNSPSLVTDGIEEVIGDMVDNGRISGAIVEDLGLITEGTSNLFDFTTVTAGRLNTSTGEVGEASGYWTSDYIAVESGKTYYFANTDRRVAYNSSKAYSANISGTTWTASANGYVRVSVTSANRKTAKINEGSAKDYRPGRSPIDFNLRDDVYRKAEVDAALAAVTIATDPELETAGAAADAKATGDAISALNESLGNKVDSTPDAQPVVQTGTVSVVNRKLKFNNPTDYVTGQYSEPFECTEGDKFIYFGESRTGAWGNVYYLDSEDNCDNYTNIKGVYPYKIITIPAGCSKVVFASSYSPSVTDPIPYLYVRKIYDATLSQAIGIGNGVSGQVWTKTASGAKWETDVLKEAASNGAGFNNTYITYSESQHFLLQVNSTDNNRMDYNRADVHNVVRTNVIPCEAGYAFLVKHNGIVGVASRQAFFLDEEFDIVSHIYSNSEVFIAPQGTKYAIFQSMRTDEVPPTLSVKPINPVVSSTLSGKKVAVIGDSITEGTGSIGGMYHTYLAGYCGCNVVNLGVGYTGFYAKSSAGNDNYISRVSSIPNDTDLIIVCGSFNDIHGGGVSLGTIDDDTDTTIAGCMNLFFTALLTAFPDKAIGIITTGPWQQFHRGVTASDNYVAMLEQMGLKYGIPFYEIYDRTNLRPWDDTNRATYFSDTAGVHPNTVGHQIMFAALRGFLESLIV